MRSNAFDEVSVIVVGEFEFFRSGFNDFGDGFVMYMTHIRVEVVLYLKIEAAANPGGEWMLSKVSAGT